MLGHALRHQNTNLTVSVRQLIMITVFIRLIAARIIRIYILNLKCGYVSIYVSIYLCRQNNEQDQT